MTVESCDVSRIAQQDKKNGGLPMSDSTLLFASVGTIARRLCVPVHRVQYIVRSRGIKPKGRAGNTKVFDEPEITRIAEELRLIEETRSQCDG